MEAESATLAHVIVPAAAGLLGALIGSLAPALVKEWTRSRAAAEARKKQLQRLYARLLLATRQTNVAVWSGIAADRDKHALQAVTLLDEIEILDRDAGSIARAEEMREHSLTSGAEKGSPFLVNRRRLLDRLQERFGVDA